MTSQGLNKVLRGNLNLKPLILSKNPSDIVNGYVQRFYQQLPENLKRELMKPRAAESQHENWSMLKNLRISSTPAFVENTKINSRPQAMKASALGATSARNKLLKSPNFKIYNNRKYTSSATSSSVSVHRNNYGDRRKRFTRAFGTTARSSVVPTPVPQKSSPQRTPLRHYTASVLSKSPRAPTEICKDLMPVNRQLKKQIRLNKSKPLSETLELPKKAAVDLSFYGWDHPSPEYLKKLVPTISFRKPPAIRVERGLLNLMDFKKMPFSAKSNGKSSAAKNRSDCESLDKGFGAQSTKTPFGRMKKRENSNRSNFVRSPRTPNAALVQGAILGREMETSRVSRKH